MFKFLSVCFLLTFTTATAFSAEKMTPETIKKELKGEIKKDNPTKCKAKDKKCLENEKLEMKKELTGEKK